MGFCFSELCLYSSYCYKLAYRLKMVFKCWWVVEFVYVVNPYPGVIFGFCYALKFIQHTTKNNVL